MGSQVGSGDTVGLVGLVLQYLVLPVIGFVTWAFTKLMRLEGRVDALEDWKKENGDQHKEVMGALNNHNEGVQNRLQSIEEHLRGGHNTG